MDVTIVGVSSDTPVINYTPSTIDEYIVVVNLPEDWETVHNYIINENDIDGIPNRKIDCSNTQEFSLRTAIYEMSVAEADILRTHEKVESVELSPDKYPQPQSTDVVRYNKNVAFNKPILTNAYGTESTGYTNGVRSNWSHLFVNDPSSEPYQGVGISTVDTVNRDVSYSLTGKNVDTITIDSGIGALHPEFLNVEGKTRVKDVILDGPFKVDPDYFTGIGVTYNRVLDGVDIGVGIATTSAEEWWENAAKRSAKFSSLGTVSIPSTYTVGQAFSKTSSGEANPILDAHGTSCASQIGGKSFGLAFESNIWNIRIALSGDGGVISGDTALNVCTVWHNAKKINSTDPDPTIVNNSWGSTISTGNDNGSTYSHHYRGNNLTYTGSGSDNTIPSNSGACRNNKYFTVNSGSGSALLGYTGTGQYNAGSSSTSSAAENSIAAGCIVVSSAGNTNQKLCDKDDVDFGNWVTLSNNYMNQARGVQQGFSGDHDKDKGTIRVGALDCAVDPEDEKQGVAKYSVRKVVYSANGSMIDIWAPAEFTMAAGYATGETYQRTDDSNFYDRWFNGTSAACPNTCSVIALYLQSNRGATQSEVRDWLKTSGSKTIALSDPYSGVNDTGYWTVAYNATYDASSKANQSYNVRGNGNLRGAPNRVLFNPFANDTVRSISGVSISGVSITNS